MRLRHFVTSLPVAVVSAALACGGPPAPTTQKILVTEAGAPLPRVAGSCTPWTPVPAAPVAREPEPSPETIDRRLKPRKKGDLCETADSNLARAEASILAGAGGGLTSRRDWDHVAKPERFDKVARRLSLTTAERALLSKNGFVVLGHDPSKTYAWALHEVYQSELPLYVSADAILHAVYTSNDHLLAAIENETLQPLLGRTLSAMHCALTEASRAYPPEVAHDLDLYLTVARTLLADAPVASVLGTDTEAASLVAAAKQAKGIGTLELFGRVRYVDWSQYQPRGHYAPPRERQPDELQDDDRPLLAAYFRAGMWLSRLEMNLVSRSSRSSLLGGPDPTETPREAIDALALADLVDRAAAGPDVARLDRAWALLAGRREDVSIADLAVLRKKAGIDAIDLGSFDKLKAAIGNDFQRTARTHPTPEGTPVLPAIATFLGPRIVADSAAFRPLVHTEVSDRYLVGAGDVAYVLGLDRGKEYLKDDLAKHPTLASKLDEARRTITTAKDAGDLYGAWLGALRGVAAPLPATVPSFMRTPAYDDLRLNTLVAGYGQIRHNYVLMAAQAYDEGGCEIPDGWLEPLPAVYEGIASYGARGARVMKELDPKDTTKAGAYFAELEKVTRVLATIARHEVEGRALSTEEKRFLSMVVEMSPGSTGSAPTYTGWYFDLFRGRWEEGLATASFVADYYTSTSAGRAVYAGATGPRMGVFVIDAGGAPRLAVGPVARAYEIDSGLDKRLDDHAAEEVAGKRDPWAASYTAPSEKVPGIAAAATFSYEEAGKPSRVHATLRAAAALPKVVVELLDHHRVPVLTTTRSVPANGVVVFDLSVRGAEGMRIRIGEYAAEDFVGGPSSSVSIERGGVTTDEKDFRY